jgi:hypothetical protein
MAKKKKQKKAVAPPPPVAKKAPRASAGTEAPTRRQLERAAQRKQERREGLRRKLVAAGLATAAVAAVAAYVVREQQQDAELREALTAGSCEIDTESDRISGGDGHVPAPTYAVNPPAGGDHLSAAARSGVYEGNGVPQDGLLVHSLEHGYIVAWHSPDLPAEQKEQLEQFAARHEPDVIVAERPGIPVPVAATAWGQRLLCQSVEPEVLDRFYDEHVGNGPEDVERT